MQLYSIYNEAAVIENDCYEECIQDGNYCRKRRDEKQKDKFIILFLILFETWVQNA